jgi:hypothetical protein
MESLSEKKVHDLIIASPLVQDGIRNILGIDFDIRFVHEDEYINGLIADFTIIANDEIVGIMEVKGGNINVTDYVRGIGQLFQYEYFHVKNISPRSKEYSEKFSTVYFFPSSVIKNNQFNIGRFQYPTSTKIAEINERSNAVRLLSVEELGRLEEAVLNNVVTVSPYYFRDNRIFEYFILLKFLSICRAMGISSVNRNRVEDRFLTRIETINNGNWRNAFITLSSLGLINSRNVPTKAGDKLSTLDYGDFAVEIYHSYIEPYATEIIDCFNGRTEVRLANDDFSRKIKSKFGDRDVLFLTQSSNRYISSWLNILRDDYGIIDFAPRTSHRVLNYNPRDLNITAFRRYILQYSIAMRYIGRFQELIREIQIDELHNI